MPSTFQKILFPTDFSVLSLAALGHAKALTGAFDSELHCLHVVDDAYQYWSAMGPESIPLGPPPENLVELAATRMEQFVSEHLSDLKREPVTRVVLGRPFVEIIGYSRENNTDLIVMGTHGRGALAHMLLGSTTEKVVRKATCAVMSIRAPDQDFTMP